MPSEGVSFKVTPRQRAFLSASEREVLFGGAAGGGKSFGQLIDAFLYALRYPKSKQLILRRTYPELEKSLIRVSRTIYPGSVYTYNGSNHVGYFKNGSLIDFGYSASEADVFQYQSAEYDVIRFDELTHFTEFQYVYMLSRLRGVNGYPKQIKSSTNPGGIGHAWVKERFIDPSPPDTPFVGEDGGSRIFLPAKIDDNPFLVRADPEYRERLLALPEEQKRALLFGDWNLLEGRFFREFRYDLHTVDPFPIPAHWRKYRTLDYGLDRLACLWAALDPDGNVWIYREVCRSDLIISDAARAILSAEGAGETVYATLSPPDLFARSQESGRSRALLFAEHGVRLTKTENDRETGWLAVKELLKQEGDRPPRCRIFRTCTELIRCLSSIECDPARPGDVRSEPHRLTHAPDALRGFAIYYARPNPIEERVRGRRWTPDQWEDYENADRAGRDYLLRRYGKPE